MAEVKFIDWNEEIPSYDASYKGWYIMKDSKLYIGTDNGWKELTKKRSLFFLYFHKYKKNKY